MAFSPRELPTEQWYTGIGDNTLADAILDRLMHNPHRLQLKGESMRKMSGRGRLAPLQET